MDLKRIQQLAGLPITESVQVTEGTSHEYHTEIHAVGPTMGQLDNVIVMDDNPAVKMIAETLGIPDGWKMVPLGDGYAAYNSGDRLTFFKNARDFQADDEEY